MSSSNSKQPAPPKPPGSQDQSMLGMPKSSVRGRKPTNKPPQEKKQPQRGLGVAQLERLRLQERWKKMTEMPSSENNNINVNDSIVVHGQPLESVPVQYGAGGGYGGDAARAILSGGGGVVGSGSAVMDHGGNMIIDNNNQYHHQSPKNNNLHYLVPNPSDYFDHNNNATFKKKRLMSGEGNGGMREKYGAPPSDHHQILQVGSHGLNMYANNNNVNNMENNTVPNNYYYNNNTNASVGDHLTLGFATPSKLLPIRSSSDLILHNLDPPHSQAVEIRAVHRRGNNNNIGGIDNSVVMEYEFFPVGHNARPRVVSPPPTVSETKLLLGSAADRHDRHHPQRQPNNHGYGNGGDGDGGANNNNHLDLSLKL